MSEFCFFINCLMPAQVVVWFFFSFYFGQLRNCFIEIGLEFGQFTNVIITRNEFFFGYSWIQAIVIHSLKVFFT